MIQIPPSPSLVSRGFTEFIHQNEFEACDDFWSFITIHQGSLLVQQSYDSADRDEDAALLSVFGPRLETLTLTGVKPNL